MKKAAALFLTAVMLLMLGAAGAEQSEITRFGVFNIYDTNGENVTWTGVGIPVLPGVLMVPEANLPEDCDHAVLSDGSGLWEAEIALSVPETMVAFVAFDCETEVPSLSPWGLYSGIPDINSVYVYDTNASGDQMNRTVSSMTPLTWEKMDCMTVTLSGSARPGDPLFTEGNELAGMILAEYSGGVNRYIALTPSGIADLIGRMAELAGEMADALKLQEGFEFTAEENMVTFDWSGVSRTAGEGKNLYLVVADVKNDYLNYGKADQENTSITMLLTPGRTYRAGMSESAEIPSQVSADFAVVMLPEAERLKDKGFTEIMTALVLNREDLDRAAEHPPEALSVLTADELRNEKLCFFAWSRYDTDEWGEDTLLVSLITPDGMDYRYSTGWVYDESYEDADIWFIPLEDMGFTDVLEEKGYPAGEYRMSYYVGGALGGTFTFEVR